MKILHIVDYIGPHGGLYQILTKLDDHLKKYGIENRYLALEITPYYLDPKLNVLHIDILEKDNFYNYISEYNPDIIHIHSDINNDYFEYCINNYNTVRSIFDWGPFCAKQHFDNAYCKYDDIYKHKHDISFVENVCLKNKCINKNDCCSYKTKLELLKKVPKFVVLSEANKEYLIKMGISEKKIFKMPPIMRPPQKYSEPPTDNIILFAGRIVYHKGTEFLLKSLLKLKNNNWKLLIEGTGDKRYVASLVKFAIENGIEKKIEFLGHKPYEEYREIFTKARLLVFPSVYAEGFGYPGYEAMLNGIPIVAFEGIGGEREWLHDDYNGLVVPYKNIEAMAAAIDSILSDDERYSRYRENSIKWSKSICFDNEILEMKKFYCNLLEERGTDIIMNKKALVEICMREAFEFEENLEIDFDKRLDEYGVNSISFIKMLVLLENKLEIEFDEATFDFEECNTGNKILHYIEQVNETK
ncbi:glycosyltransferase [Blautia pseudococcoides]|nr:glycosyltransferase [Blautia pseudococcoides]